MSEVTRLDLARVIDGLLAQGQTAEDVREMVDEVLEESEGE